MAYLLETLSTDAWNTFERRSSFSKNYSQELQLAWLNHWFAHVEAFRTKAEKEGLTETVAEVDRIIVSQKKYMELTYGP